MRRAWAGGRREARLEAGVNLKAEVLEAHLQVVARELSVSVHRRAGFAQRRRGGRTMPTALRLRAGSLGQPRTSTAYDVAISIRRCLFLIMPLLRGRHDEGMSATRTGCGCEEGRARPKEGEGTH